MGSAPSANSSELDDEQGSGSGTASRDQIVSQERLENVLLLLKCADRTHNNQRLVLRYLQTVEMVYRKGGCREDRAAVLQALIQGQYIPAVMRIWVDIILPYVRKTMGNPTSEDWVTMKIIKSTSGMVFSASNNSKEICRQIVDTHLYEHLFHTLDLCHVTPVFRHEQNLVIDVLGSLLNVCVYGNVFCEFRSVGAVEIATRFKTSNGSIIKVGGT